MTTVQRNFRALAMLFLAASVSGCAGGLFGTRHDVAKDIANGVGMIPEQFVTTHFLIKGYWLPVASARSIAVYFEGDGSAFLSRTQVSPDPTPRDPISLRLAATEANYISMQIKQHAADQRDRTVVYLSRPCQYLSEGDMLGACNPLFWTTHRFAPEVLSAYQEILATIKRKLSVNRIDLIGFSGGGTIASLIAAERPDVGHLVTFGGALDLDEWTRVRRLSPLTGSKNPASARGLASVDQVHFVGGDDERIPVSIAQAYVRRVGGKASNAIRIVPRVDHSCCWKDFWDTVVATRKEATIAATLVAVRGATQ